MKYIMKRICFLILLCSVVAYSYAEQETSVTRQAFAASNQEYKKPLHYIGLGAKLGYSQFNMKVTGDGNQKWNIPGGANAGLEFRYKLEKNAFRFTVGLDATYAGNSFRGNITDSRQLYLPTQEMTFHYNINDIREMEHVLEVGLPIMVGANFKGFYAQAGVRLGLPVWNKYKLTSNIETTITDVRAIEDYTNMPNHYLTTYSKDNNAKMDLSMLNPQVAIELGTSLDRWMQKKIENFEPGYKPTFAELLHYEVALYANIGVLDYHQSPKGEFYSYTEGQIPEIASVQTITADKERATKTMVPWNVGVRFNVYYELFEAPKAPKKKRQHRDRPDAVIEEEPEPVIEEVVYKGDTVQKGDTIRLDNLYFDTDKTIILPNSMWVVEDLATWLNENPSIKITLVGHTDNVGTARYNKRLSQGRVNSVKAELVKRGVGADRVNTVGKGLTEPIADNSTAEGRAKNRRVEIIIDEK